MPWKIVKGHKGCPKSKPFAVINKSTGRKAGCHKTKQGAKSQIAALNIHANSVQRVVASALRLVEANRSMRKERDLKSPYSQVERVARATFRAQKQAFMAEFKRMKGDFKEAPRKARVDSAWKKAEGKSKRLVSAIDSQGKLALDRGAKSALKDLAAAGTDINFKLQDPLAQAFLKSNGAKKVKGINTTTRKRIQTVLNNAAEKGWSYNRTAEEIDDVFDAMTTTVAGQEITRSLLIAVTEMGEAYEAGRAIVLKKFQKAGLPTEKSWISVGDDRVCEICEPNASAGWIAGKSSFPSGQDRPLGHPGCRCDMSVRVA